MYGMSTLLKFLFANGAGAVKAVAVGKDESEEKDYASAFAALSDEEDVGVMVRGGVTPIETVGGVSSPVRGITTKTSSGGGHDVARADDHFDRG